MIWLALLLAAQAASLPPQVERGQTLFFGDAHCGTCHALKGRGTAVGPDLKVIGRVPPRAIAMAIRATRTQYVKDVKSKEGEFPGMQVSEEGGVVQIWDLNADPPALKKLAKTDIESMTDNSTWKHPPSTAKLTDEQIADLVAFIRWAATGERKVVDPSEVE